MDCTSDVLLLGRLRDSHFSLGSNESEPLLKRLMLSVVQLLHILTSQFVTDAHHRLTKTIIIQED